MSIFVVDASVGIKWLVPEIHTDSALRLQDPAHHLHIPSFFDVEIGNILWKKVRRAELTRLEADGAMAKLGTLPIMRHSDGPLIPSAFDIANITQRTVYDCMYLALAVQLGGQMVTADEKLLNSLASTTWSGSIIGVQSVP